MFSISQFHYTSKFSGNITENSIVSIVFLDAMITFLQKNPDVPISSAIITKLKRYIKDEEYDTDSIYLDIDNLQRYEYNTSNIFSGHV